MRGDDDAGIDPHKSIKDANIFVDTPSGPGEGLLTVIRAIPEAKAIIVTAPHKISGDRAKNMINFFRKELRLIKENQ